jgi:ElaB/YqjD/DUF883 family membrane-anchored ribosome-binding protein
VDQVAREKLASDFRALIDDVEELLRATANQTGESAKELRGRLEKKLEEGKRVLSEQQKVFLEKAEEARISTEAYVRENPWSTVGIAAGVGLVLGLLLRRG